MKNRITVFFLVALLLSLIACDFPVKTEDVSPLPTEREADAGNMVYITIDSTGVADVSLVEPEKSIEPTSQLKAEADGNERTRSERLISDAEILCEPKDNAGVIAQIKRGTGIDVIGLSEKENYYKIAYNGRVAYVAVKAVANGNTANETNANSAEQGQNRNSNSPGANTTTNENGQTSSQVYDSRNNSEPNAGNSQPSTVPSGDSTGSVSAPNSEQNNNEDSNGGNNSPEANADTSGGDSGGEQATLPSDSETGSQENPPSEDVNPTEPETPTPTEPETPTPTEPETPTEPDPPGDDSDLNNEG